MLFYTTCVRFEFVKSAEVTLCGWQGYRMKNFNRRSSHSDHGSKCRGLAQHALSHGSHAFTHTLTITSTQLQSRCVKRQLSYYFSVHAGSFHVCNPPNFDMDYRIFIVHTWPFLCYITHGGWAHWQLVSTTFLTRKKSKKCIVLLMGFEPRSFGSRVRRSTNWATPSPQQTIVFKVAYDFEKVQDRRGKSLSVRVCVHAPCKWFWKLY